MLRRADLLDLFDTTPDLSGNDLDVSRFIRASEDKDAYLAWRDWEGEALPQEMPKLVDRELCPVPIGELREFPKKHAVYAWNFALEEWARVETGQIYPGMLAVTRSSEGGYTAEEGWSPESKKTVPDLRDPKKSKEEGDSSDSRSFPEYRQLLKDHTDRVTQEVKSLLDAAALDPEHSTALLRAAELHDWGKSHDVFQATMNKHEASREMWAKQCGNARHCRPHFRHELASALAMIETGESDLAAYLAAAHHGRIRMGIRSMPGEREQDGKRIARGIFEGDALPECEVASGVPESAGGAFAGVDGVRGRGRFLDRTDAPAARPPGTISPGVFRNAAVRGGRRGERESWTQRGGMHRLILKACTAAPFGAYLKALGVFRLIAEQRDADARGSWSGDTFVLESNLDQDQLAAFSGAIRADADSCAME